MKPPPLGGGFCLQGINKSCGNPYQKGGDGMKKLSLVLVIVLLVSGIIGAVPYPYGVYELETTGDLKEIHDEIAKKHTVSVQFEDGNFYPWHEMSNAKIETRMSIDAKVNRDADHQFWTPAERELNKQKLYADFLDNRVTFLFMLFADSPGTGSKKYLEMGTSASGVDRVLLEVDGDIYLPIGFEPLSATDQMGLNYAYFPRYDGERQIIDINTKLARLWLISETNRVFFDFPFDPYHGDIAETAPVISSSAVEKKTVETKSVTVHITRTGSKYHRAGCRYLSKSSIPIALSAAKRSYGACSVCKPPR